MEKSVNLLPNFSVQPPYNICAGFLGEFKAG